jgi:aspartyl protease family protein
MGLDLAALDYDVEVTTANGSAMAAETRLAELAVGPIVVHNVRALIAKPGALSENLLGMSFLERLQSYTVERGKLVLKAR